MDMRILDMNAIELDRAQNWDTAKAVAKRHADRLGHSTFIVGADVRFPTQVKPAVFVR